MSCFGMIAHPSRQARAAVWALSIALVIPGLIKGQSASRPASGTLRGYVRDAHGIAVPGATVALEREDGAKIRISADANGSYVFSAVAQGSYILRANAPGYREATFSSITLAEKQEKQIDLKLELAAKSSASTAKIPEFFDEPRFTVSDVTDTTNLGGHGSDTIVRTRESLARETASLGKPSPGVSPASSPEATAPKASADELRAAAERVRAAIAHEDNAELHHVLAGIEERLGQPLDAAHEYQRAAEMDPSESNLFDWGSELLLHRAPEPAIEVFAEGNRLFPRSVRMLVGLGVAWYARGSYDEATRRLCEASDLSPAESAPYLFLGKIQGVESAPSPAIAEKLQRFARLQPENALANYYYAIALWKQRKGPEDSSGLTQVQSLLEKSIRLDPTLGVAYLQLGILKDERGNLPKAISSYQQAIEVSPRLQDAHYRLAQAYRRSGEQAKADAELQLYKELAKAAAEDVERERHVVKQFVYTLRNENPTTP
jgi:tetratricopeptide (TPR) repeat protein